MSPGRGESLFRTTSYLSPLQGSWLLSDRTPGLRPGLFSDRPSGASPRAKPLSGGFLRPPAPRVETQSSAPPVTRMPARPLIDIKICRMRLPGSEGSNAAISVRVFTNCNANAGYRMSARADGGRDHRVGFCGPAGYLRASPLPTGCAPPHLRNRSDTAGCPPCCSRREC
jgi:hypothetical protein